MPLVKASLTVFFEDPFWVGVYERREGARYEACKVTFGAQPKDGEVFDWLLRGFNSLRFSPSLDAPPEEDRRINPKRMQREIHRTLQSTGVGTKAQQALSAQRELSKLERTADSRERREQEKEQRYELHAQKRKEKHRGH